MSGTAHTCNAYPCPLCHPRLTAQPLVYPRPYTCPNCNGEGVKGGVPRQMGVCQENCWSCQGSGVIWG